MLNKDLLDVLACPWCLGDLDYGDDKLTCRRCHAVYAVEDDIPIMLVEKAALHCPLCGREMTKDGDSAQCEACGRRFSMRERLETSLFGKGE